MMQRCKWAFPATHQKLQFNLLKLLVRGRKGPLAPLSCFGQEQVCATVTMLGKPFECCNRTKRNKDKYGNDNLPAWRPKPQFFFPKGGWTRFQTKEQNGDT